MKKLIVTLILLFTNVLTIQITSELETYINAHNTAEVFINLKPISTPNTNNFVNFKKTTTLQNQSKVTKYLEIFHHIKPTSFWITNTLHIKSITKKLLEIIKNIFPEDIESIELVQDINIKNENHLMRNTTTQSTMIEAGVSWIKAPQVWNLGFKGQGVTVGLIDSGVFLHDDFKSKYRGINGNHKESWLDTVNGRETPYDDLFTGTHSQGIISGESTNLKVGIAPQAEWISCKFINNVGSGSLANLLKCMEFMLAPNGNYDKRPHVISNGYGGTTNIAIENAIKALIDAGVEMVYTVGSSGPQCGSMRSPASLPYVLSVGTLLRESDEIVSRSSRGPGLNGVNKPDVSAPGTGVLSTKVGGGYVSYTGSAFASPHVVGALALFWSAKKDFLRKIQETRRVLFENAKRQRSSECSRSGLQSPNNVYGYGTVDIYKAVTNAGK